MAFFYAGGLALCVGTLLGLVAATSVPRGWALVVAACDHS